MSQETTSAKNLLRSTRHYLPHAAVLLAVFIAYLPALRAGFVWDDDAYVTNNPLLTAAGGFSEIWFSAHRQSQYFPLAFTTLRFERMFWGLNPMGYHAVNVLLHGLNALFAWAVLKRLAIPGAWLAAAVFALHPVQVESVAWITELKNTESTLFYLLALLAWLKFTDDRSPTRWSYYLLALALYVFALFSKTTACTLPAALLLAVWLRKQPITASIWVQVLPFLFLGLALGLVSVWWEGHLGSYKQESGTALSTVERFLVATRALWFYAGKLVWPANLTFSYPRWDVDPHQPTHYVWAIGCLGVGLALWFGRRILGRGPLAAVLFFVATLSPLLGFISCYTFRYSFVADHYQYLACLGLITLFVGALNKRLKALAPGIQRGGCCLLLVVLGTATWRQATNYRDNETLWRDTAAKNPASWMALNFLGYYAQHRGDLPQAIEYYRQSIVAKPDFEALDNLGGALAIQGQMEEAIAAFRKAVQLHPSGSIYYNLASALAKLGQLDEAVGCFQKSIELSPGRVEPRVALGAVLEQLDRTKEAVAYYQEVLRLWPHTVDALRNLAAIRASDSNPELRNGAEAVALAEKACELTRYQEPASVSFLALAYAENGSFEKATAMAIKAQNLAASAGDAEGAEANRKLVELFRSGQAYHDLPNSTNAPSSDRKRP